MIVVETERLKIMPLDRQNLELSIIDFNKMEYSLGLVCTDENIGYYTQPHFRGYGCMSEAVIGIVEWIFLNSDVKAVTADTLKSNLISQNLLKKWV